MKLFHGTTLNRFLQALKDGYLGTHKSVWNCSLPYTIYFYGEDKLKEEYEESWYEEGIKRALESSEFALAQERKNLRRVVLVLDSNDLEHFGHLDIDTSCDELSNTYQFEGQIPIELVKEIWIDTEDRDLFLLYYIGKAHWITEKINHGILTIEGYDNDISTEVLEASLHVYNSLNEYYMETFINDYERVLEEISIEKLKRRYNIP